MAQNFARSYVTQTSFYTFHLETLIEISVPRREEYVTDKLVNSDNPPGPINMIPREYVSEFVLPHPRNESFS
jgi:hypothetical protein